MEGYSGQGLEGTWNRGWGRIGKRPRQVEASGCCGNGPEWPVNA